MALKQCGKVFSKGIEYICSSRARNGFAITSSNNLQYFYRQYSRTRLSPVEITDIITKNETSSEINQRSIKSFDTNELASNSPIEDARAEARCLLTTGLLFGVFDGHGGHTCAQVVAKRLFSYIAASLLPSDVLQKFLDTSIDYNTSEGIPLLDRYNDELSLRQDLQQIYTMSFQHYLQSLAAQKENETFEMRKALQRAFERLDGDISTEAQGDHGVDQRLILSIALSGAVSCVAHVDGEHMHVASCGDCRAVLGVRTDRDGAEGWKAKVLTNEHNTSNESEVARVLSEHPDHEHERIIVNDRLMGQLAPLRAFGDCRFKWSKEMLSEFAAPHMNHPLLPQSLTPPYLTASPEVTYHKLRAKDAFLILGTDGLWDMLSPNQAVRLVGEHMSGKTVLSPFTIPEEAGRVTLGSIHEVLMKRMESFKVKPIDSNAATHLIRHSLGGTPEGLDNNRLSSFLTLPEKTSRTYRDDITVTVIFFDPDYLSQRPF